MTLRQRWKKTTIANKAVVAVGVMSFLLAAVQSGVAYWMERAASAQTDRLVLAAEMVTQNLKKANEQQLAAIQSTAEQTRAEIDAQLRAANAQMQLQMDALRVEQRPWLSVENCLLDQEPAPFPKDPRGRLRREFTNEEFLASRLSIHCQLANSGKTPALDLLPRVAINVGERPALKQPLTPIVQGASDRHFVFPGGRQRVSHEERTPALTEPYLRGNPLYIVIRVDYQDAFGARHWTEACRQRTVNMPLALFNHCGGRADADPLPRSSKP